MMSDFSWALLGCKPQAIKVLENCLSHRLKPKVVITPPGCPHDDVVNMANICKKNNVLHIPLDSRRQLLGLSLPNIIFTCRFFILKDETIKDKRCYNVHSSLLPRWAGVHPVEWSLINGDVETGVTIHSIIDAIDEGGIVARQRCSIGINNTANLLRKRLDNISASLVYDVLKTLSSGREPMVLAEIPGIEGSWARRRYLMDSEFKWPISGMSLHNLIRALNGTEYMAFFMDKNKKISIESSVATICNNLSDKRLTPKVHNVKDRAWRLVFSDIILDVILDKPYDLQRFLRSIE